MFELDVNEIIKVVCGGSRTTIKDYEDLPVSLDDEIDMLTCDVSNIMNHFNESRYVLEKKLSHSERKNLFQN